MMAVDEHVSSTEVDFGLDDEAGGILVDPGSSVLDAIRDRRAQLTHEHVYDLKVPGYRGLLVLRCAPIRGAKLTQLRTRLETSKDPERDFGLNADVLIDSCQAVLARRSLEDEFETLDPTGEVVRIDSRLAELLKLDTTRARDVVRELFAAAPSPELACGVAVGDFAAWSSGADLEVEDDLLGESLPAGR